MAGAGRSRLRGRRLRDRVGGGAGHLPAGEAQRGLEADGGRGRPSIVIIRFGLADCRACPVRSLCVASGRERVLRIRRREEYEALRIARQRQTTAEFKERYATRAGVEGTPSQGVRRCGLRRSRYIGLAKTELSHFVIAAALNFQRTAAWLAEVPPSKTRRSAFAALAPAAA